MKSALPALCAAALALAGVASAEERGGSEFVRTQVASRADSGEKLVGEIIIGRMRPAELVKYTFGIDPSKEYWVYGACDADCSNIDLLGSDASGAEVDTDALEDNAPVLWIEPGSSGDKLTVTILMAECATDTCVTGVGLYEAGAREERESYQARVARESQEILRYLTLLSDEDHVLVSDILIGEAGQDDRLEFAFDIDPRKTYLVFGGCAGDCRDIDLRALAPSGGTVDEDLSEDALPILTIKPGSSGATLTVILEMAACGTLVCTAGVGLYEAAP